MHVHIAVRLLHFVSQIQPIWSYSLIFITSLFEGLPLVGLFSPGGIFTSLGGLLIKINLLSLPVTFVVAFSAAVVGDSLGYFIGKKYGYGLLKKYGKYFFLKEERRIEKTHDLVKEHPAKAIILGRFYYISRSISPFLAGTASIGYGQFFLYDLLGALLWAVVHIAGGYVFGYGYETASKYVNYVLLGATILSISIFYLYEFINRQHTVFKKYHIYTVILNILSIYTLAQIIEDVMNKEHLYYLDRLIQSHITKIWSPIGINFFKGLTYLGGLYGASLISILVLIAITHKKRLSQLVIFCFAVSFSLISEFIMKYAFHVMRPLHSLVSTEYYSFPSGHATIITTLGILIFYFFRSDFKNAWVRRLFVFGDIVIVLGVCFSRIYLNAHWTTDVLAGMVLGLFWTTLYILIVQGIIHTEKRPLHLLRKILFRHKDENNVSLSS